jgi:hypothetical protein
MNDLDDDIVEYKESVIKQIEALHYDLRSKINCILNDPNLTSKISYIEREYNLFDDKRKKLIIQSILKTIQLKNK